MATGLRECAGGADRLVVIDTETTGVYPSDRIVEIALITLSLDGDILDLFETLVQPRRDVSASHIHGITASMVQTAPTFADIAGDVAVRLNGACLVAHNLPFDFRMLAGEFDRIGSQLTMISGVDTLRATSCRLHEACSMFGVTLEDAHRAIADATATAELLRRVVTQCSVGSPVAAPTGIVRSGLVLRREDTAPARLVDPPLIVYLSSRLPHTGVEVGMLEYLELVGRAVADMRLDQSERGQLKSLAHDLGLTAAHIAQAHRRFINELIDAAVADGAVTDDEYETLVRIASALEVDQQTVELRIRPFRASDSATVINPAMTLVFTGDHPRHEREALVKMAEEIGLIVQAGVSKSTELVVAADPASNSGKAGKARKYGIPIMSVDDFVTARIGDSVTSHGTGRAALKVITCPDCYATWTVPATTAGRRLKRCADCLTLAPRTS